MEYVGYAAIGIEIAAILAGFWWLGRPEYCFYWSLIAGFFSGMVKIVFGGYLGYIAPEFLTALTLLGTLLYVKGRGQYFIPHLPFSRPFVLLGLWCLIEFLNPLSPPLRSLFGIRAWLFYLSLFFCRLSPGFINETNRAPLQAPLCAGCDDRADWHMAMVGAERFCRTKRRRFHLDVSSYLGSPQRSPAHLPCVLDVCDVGTIWYEYGFRLVDHHDAVV